MLAHFHGNVDEPHPHIAVGNCFDSSWPILSYNSNGLSRHS
jgi:hypothetical protein